MKRFRNIIIGLLVVLLLVLAVGLGFIYSTGPEYSGEFEIDGISEKVSIHFDTYGVPHIYAENEEDAYFALGFTHAQERLFQMEMIRRAASGRLSEILGPEFISTDKFFLSLGINKIAKESAEYYLSNPTEQYQKSALSYQAGVNAYVATGSKPIEFYVMGIPLQPFTPEDFFYVAGFMSVGFAEGLRTDPILTTILENHGEEYLSCFSTHSVSGGSYAPSYTPDESIGSLSKALNQVFDVLPVPLFHGSNGWVIGSKKSANGRVMLANDTHIGFSQPSVWYEAHLVYPGNNLYGNYAAGFPFAMLGHNKNAGWGLTMFENDDVDFYRETVNPEDSMEVKKDSLWVKMSIRYDTIRVKGEDPIVFAVKESHHGPIINASMLNFPEKIRSPVSLYWTFTKQKSNLLEAAYALDNAKDIFDLRKAATMIHAPGLNVMAADKAGNFGWFTSASLINRPSGVNSKLFIDGSGEYDPSPDYDYSYNPGAYNTPWNYVYSTNNQPDSIQGVFHAGYYMPPDRSDEVQKFLENSELVSEEDMKTFQLHTTSAASSSVASYLVLLASAMELDAKTREMIELLNSWDGNHHKDLAQPAVYYTVLSLLFKNSMEDEIGQEMLQSFSQLAVFKRSILKYIQSEKSPWWDDQSTPEKETREGILAASFSQARNLLEKNLGANSDNWRWGDIHQLTHPHPLGTVGILAPFFNVGANEVDGGNETINNMMLTLNSDGVFPVTAGPAVRNIMIFGDEIEGFGILPSGQSGNFLSPHYGDQAELFANGVLRPLWTKEEEVISNSTNTIVLLPNGL